MVSGAGCTFRIPSHSFASCAMKRRFVCVSARRWSLDILLKTSRIALDSNVLIYLLEGVGPQADTAATIVDAVEGRRLEGVFASLGLIEVLVGAARSGDAARFEQTAAELRASGLRIVDLTATIAEDAAWIRGASGLPLEDAVHLATARSRSADAFVTNDRRIRSLPNLEVAYLDDLTPA